MTDPAQPTDAVLYINRSDSRCGACDRNADPHEQRHEMRVMEGEGCGALFTALSSNYTGMEARCLAMRPDLRWLDTPADPVQPTEEAVEAVYRARFGDASWEAYTSQPLGTWFQSTLGNIRRDLRAALPLLRREMAAEIRSDEMVQVIRDAVIRDGGSSRFIADAVATRIEGDNRG